MNFLKYLQQADITNVLDKLVKKHKEINPDVDVSAQVEGYLSLIVKFLHSKANTRNERILVIKYIDERGDTEEDFDGFVRVNERMLDIYFWENDLVIEDILGMHIDSIYNLEDTIAYIMFELTFCGFDPEYFGDIEKH